MAAEEQCLGGVVGARYAQGWLLPLVLLEVGPIIGAYAGAGLGYIVVEAVVITGVMTAGLAAYALTTRRSFAGVGPYLFMGLLLANMTVAPT